MRGDNRIEKVLTTLKVKPLGILLYIPNAFRLLCTRNVYYITITLCTAENGERRDRDLCENINRIRTQNENNYK